MSDISCINCDTYSTFSCFSGGAEFTVFVVEFVVVVRFICFFPTLVAIFITKIKNQLKMSNKSFERKIKTIETTFCLSDTWKCQIFLLSSTLQMSLECTNCNAISQYRFSYWNIEQPIGRRLFSSYFAIWAAFNACHCTVSVHFQLKTISQHPCKLLHKFVIWILIFHSQFLSTAVCVE